MTDTSIPVTVTLTSRFERSYRGGAVTGLADRRYRSDVDATAPIADQLNAWLRFALGTASGRGQALRTGLFLDRDVLEVLPE